MKTISKVITVVLLSPILVLAYMGLFNIPVYPNQVLSAAVMFWIWFAYMTNPITEI